jgi:folylpolyglutamate synthase
MVTCAQWFAQVTAQQPTSQQQLQQQQTVRVLIFNCMKERDPSVLLPLLHEELQKQGAPMHVALFVPPDSQYAFLPSSKTSALVAAVHQDLSWQQQLREVWQQCEAAAAATAAEDSLPALPGVPGGC